MICEIETERLIIRKFNISDKESFLSFMQNENSTRFLNFTIEQKTKKGATELLNWVISSYSSEQPIFSLALEHKNTGAYIGSVGFSPCGNSGEYECYYSINEDFTRNGYAKEAMKSLLQHAKENGIKKVFAFSHIKNYPSERLALSLGMTFNGIVQRDDLPTPAKCFTISLT